jgi:hypothetical protein
VKPTTHHLSTADAKNGWYYTSTPPYVSTVLCLVKWKNNLSYTCNPAFTYREGEIKASEIFGVR